MGKRVCPKCGAVEDEDTYRRYQARIETAERERDNAVFYEGRTAAKLAAVRECLDGLGTLTDTEKRILAILDGEGEK